MTDLEMHFSRSIQLLFASNIDIHFILLSEIKVHDLNNFVALRGFTFIFLLEAERQNIRIPAFFKRNKKKNIKHGVPRNNNRFT